MNATEKLSNLISEIRFESLPKAVVNRSKLCIQDFLGCALAGTKREVGRLLINFFLKHGGFPEATVIGSAKKIPSMNAALVNGALGSVVELDDVHKPGLIRLGVVTIPTALALSEQHKKSGKELITSIVVGYEVGAKIGMAVNPNFQKRWYTTSNCGTFAATATAAKLLGLDGRQTAQALGLAGHLSSGLTSVLYTKCRSFITGKPASNGIIAACLSKEGITSNLDIFESEKGLLAATGERRDIQKVLKKIKSELSYEMLRTSFKIHASCGQTHSAVDGVLNLIKKHKINLDDIEKVTVKTHSMAMQIAGIHNPRSLAEAKFSISYAVSLALLYGAVQPNNFPDAKGVDSAVDGFISKVAVRHEPELDNLYPQKQGAIVIIQTKKGKYKTYVQEPKGTPNNPLKPDEAYIKFEGLSHPVIGNKVESIHSILDNLEEESDVQRLMSLCS